jgi:hypothetical protein
MPACVRSAADQCQSDSGILDLGERGVELMQLTGRAPMCRPSAQTMRRMPAHHW